MASLQAWPSLKVFNNLRSIRAKHQLLQATAAYFVSSCAWPIIEKKTYRRATKKQKTGTPKYEGIDPSTHNSSPSSVSQADASSSAERGQGFHVFHHIEADYGTVAVALQPSSRRMLGALRQSLRSLAHLEGALSASPEEV